MFNYKCQNHQQCNAWAVKFDNQAKQVYRYLCLQCVNENCLQSNHCVQIEEVQQQLKHMKKTINMEAQNQLLRQKIVLLKNLRTQVQDYIQQVQRSFQNIQNQIQDKIEQAKMEYSQFLALKYFRNINEFELPKLIQYLQQNPQMETQQEFLKQQNAQNNEFIQKIRNENERLEIMRELTKFEKELDILSSSSMNVNEMSEEELEQIIDIPNHLQYKCKTHNDYYYFVELKYKNIQDSLLCLQCVTQKQNFEKIKTITNIDELWKKVQENQIKEQIQFEEQRLIKFQEIQNFQEKQYQKQYEILEIILKRNRMINNQINQLKTQQKQKKSIVNMQINDVYEAINILQKERKESTQIFSQNTAEDQNIIIDIISKMESLHQQQKLYSQYLQNLKQLQNQQEFDANKHNDSNSTDTSEHAYGGSNQNTNTKLVQTYDILKVNQAVQSSLDTADRQSQTLTIEEILSQNKEFKLLQKQIKQNQDLFEELWHQIEDKRILVNFLSQNNFETPQEDSQSFQMQTPQDDDGSQEPIALLVTQNQRSLDFLMYTLFDDSNTKEYTKYYSHILNINIVKADIFDFDDIDERERQIQQYKQLFKENPNKFMSLWIILEFDRTDTMNAQLMSIFKHMNKLKIEISVIVVDFSLTNDYHNEQKNIRQRFSKYKPNEIVFVDKNTNQYMLAKELQKALPHQNYEKPLQTKDSIFEEEDPEEQEQLMKNLQKMITNHQNK